MVLGAKMFSVNNKDQLDKLIEAAQSFQNPIFSVSGQLKSNIDNLILSPLWPQETPKELIVTDERQATLRARSIVHSYKLQQNKKFLDYGCGEGHVVIEASKLGFEAYGYDIKQSWDNPSHGILTTEKSIISANAPYSVIAAYDVLDHIMEQEQAIKAMRQIRAVSDNHTIIKVRCHPWTSRHGAHLYNSINKAFAHILLSEEELQKHITEPVRRITRPLAEYQLIFEKAGLHVVSMERRLAPLEPLFKTQQMVDIFYHKLGGNREWQESVLPIIFVDYTLTIT